MTIQESNLDTHKIIRHTAIRPSRGIANDVKELHNRSDDLLQMIKPPGVNQYKQVELYYKYHPVVPAEYHLDKFYIKSPNEVLKKVKEEKVIQIENRAKVKAVKEDKVGVTDLKEDAHVVKKLKVAEIKEALKKHGLPADGLMAKLLACLEAHLANAQTSVIVQASSPTSDVDMEDTKLVAEDKTI
jgi:hypothetical protein